jgi:hypothetical protein
MTEDRVADRGEKVLLPLIEQPSDRRERVLQGDSHPQQAAKSDGQIREIA